MYPSAQEILQFTAHWKSIAIYISHTITTLHLNMYWTTLTWREPRCYHKKCIAEKLTFPKLTRPDRWGESGDCYLLNIFTSFLHCSSNWIDRRLKVKKSQLLAEFRWASCACLKLFLRTFGNTDKRKAKRQVADCREWSWLVNLQNKIKADKYKRKKAALEKTKNQKQKDKL